MATLAEKVEAVYKNPQQLANAKDYLNMLAASEGTANQGDNGYNIMFRGGKINSYNAHPNQRHEYIDKQGRKGVSTAAGRYQFLYSTYMGTAKKLGITDFSPESQDKVAIALMLERGVDFNNGADLATNVNKINNTWTSLTGSTLGAQYHSQRDPQFLLDAFNNSRRARGADPVTTKWGNVTYQTAPVAPVDAKALMAKSQSYLESLGLPKDGLFGEAVRDIRNRTYADSGYIPWQFYSGDKFTVSSNPHLNEANLASMESRLHNTNPNVQYGVSSFGDGLHPTVAVQQPNGNVAVGTDVATTMAVAPALDDGGVPVEDATQGTHRVQSPTQLVEDKLQVPVPVRRPVPTAVPATQTSNTSVSAASGSPAITPRATDSGAAQTAVPATASMASVPTMALLQQDPAVANLSVPSEQVYATQTDIDANKPLTVGGFAIPWIAGNEDAGVPQFWATDSDSARALLANTRIRPADMPSEFK